MNSLARARIVNEVGAHNEALCDKLHKTLGVVRSLNATLAQSEIALAQYEGPRALHVAGGHCQFGWRISLHGGAET